MLNFKDVAMKNTIQIVKNISHNIIKSVYITDVTLRDGLQSYPKIISPKNRVIIGKKIAELGITNIEVGSIVSNKVIPQMKHSIIVYKIMKTFKPYLNYYMSASNSSGMKVLMDNDVKDIAFFTSPSNKFNLKNINNTTKKSFINIKNMVNQVTNNAYIKGYLSCINECPYEGPLKIDNILKSINDLYDIGMNEICLSDTLGTLNEKVLDEILYNLNFEVINKISIHLHQKQNNKWKDVIDCCLDYNISSFDTSLLNLGGCPAAFSSNEKSGNLNLHDFTSHLDLLGYMHNIKTYKIKNVEKEIQEILDRS